MRVHSEQIRIQTKKENDVVDLTDSVREILEKSKLMIGFATVFLTGSTGAITTIEYEPGLIQDFSTMLQRVIPKDIEYEHEKMWHDGNGHSHIRASLIGPSLTIPVMNGELALGTWQQVVFVEMDTRPRERNIIVQLLGE
jgi:secondary thiamine-phosphate synthase enzyme